MNQTWADALADFVYNTLTVGVGDAAWDLFYYALWALNGYNTIPCDFIARFPALFGEC
jgi:hypothetical protein